MRKVFLTGVTLLFFLAGFSQTWRYESGGNDFDGKYKTAYVQGKGGQFPYSNPTLVINTFDNDEESINFYIKDAGFFQEKTGIEVLWVFDNEPKVIYSTYSFSLSSDGKILFLKMFNNPNSGNKINQYEFINKLRNASRVSIRISDRYGNDDFSFSLSGSTRAINSVIPAEKMKDIIFEITQAKEIEAKKEELEHKKNIEFVKIRNEKIDLLLQFAIKMKLDNASYVRLKMIFKADLDDISKFNEYTSIEFRPYSDSKLFENDGRVDAHYVFADGTGAKIDGKFNVSMNSPLFEIVRDAAAEAQRKADEIATEVQRNELAQKNKLKVILKKYNNENLIGYMLEKVIYYQGINGFELNEISNVTSTFSKIQYGAIQELYVKIHLDDNKILERRLYISKFQISKRDVKEMGGRLDVAF
jgi:hypothetical protein